MNQAAMRVWAESYSYAPPVLPLERSQAVGILMSHKGKVDLHGPNPNHLCGAASLCRAARSIVAFWGSLYCLRFKRPDEQRPMVVVVIYLGGPSCGPRCWTRAHPIAPASIWQAEARKPEAPLRSSCGASVRRGELCQNWLLHFHSLRNMSDVVLVLPGTWQMEVHGKVSLCWPYVSIPLLVKFHTGRF